MTRRTAYVSHEHTTAGQHQVTVDLHVLWEAGASASVLHDLVDSAVRELHEQVTAHAA